MKSLIRIATIILFLIPGTHSLRAQIVIINPLNIEGGFSMLPELRQSSKNNNNRILKSEFSNITQERISEEQKNSKMNLNKICINEDCFCLHSNLLLCHKSYECRRCKFLTTTTKSKSDLQKIK
jgi:hypothetical protein